MKTQLPPELVEKMWSAVSKHHITMDVPELSDECAKIAVDYAKEKYFYWDNRNIQLVEENNELKQQRDELIECLKSITSDYLSGELLTINQMETANKLLKKHEDGKE